MSRRQHLALVALAAGLASGGWTLDRHAPARKGNELFKAGSYAEAEAKYNEGLVDQPDSSLLNFNRGDAAYKQGRFDDALASFGRAEGGDADGGRRARAAYNAGNAKYRLGQATETSDPKKTLDLWAEALVAYRRAIIADSADPDPKFNYEMVQKKIAELQERLKKEQEEQEQQQQQQQQQDQGEEQKEEEQQQDQAEQQQDQQQPQDQQEQQQQEEQQKQEQAEQKPEDQPQPEQQPEQEQAEQQPKQEQQEQQEQAGGGGQPQAAGEEQKESLSEREAGALLDSLRDEEVKPEEMVRQLQGGVVAEPSRDW